MIKNTCVTCGPNMERAIRSLERKKNKLYDHHAFMGRLPHSLPILKEISSKIDAIESVIEAFKALRPSRRRRKR